MEPHADAKILLFMKREAMSESAPKRSTTQSVAVSPEEQALLAVLSMKAKGSVSGLMRSLMYRGLEEFLKDRRTTPQRDWVDIYQDVATVIQSDPKLRLLKQIVDETGDSDTHDSEGAKRNRK